VDSRVLECEEVLMGGGNRSSKLIFDPKEFEKLPSVQIVEGLAKTSDS
jgi:prolyl-tRNA editing enzyme YbaK/EbsC (Cys-tRNA(Pro) deacylase)